MLSADENKPTRKSGQRNRKAEKRSGKAEQLSPKAHQQLDPKQDQMDSHEQSSAPVTSVDSLPTDASLTETFPVVPSASAETVPVSFQNIANAYGDYTKKSVEQTWSFFEKLAGVRSIDKAFELQTEFARQACDALLAVSHKIRELHSEFARQRLSRVEELVEKMTQTALSPHRWSGTFGR